MFNLTPWKKKEDGGGALMPRTEHPLGRLRDEFDAWFDRFFGRWPAPFSADWGRDFDRFWGLDMEDTGKEFVVRAEAPGFEAGDFDVQVTGNLLTIRAEHKQEAEDKKGDYHYQERRYGRFQRSVTLPAGAETDKVEARYHNGVLEVHLPKSPEAQGRRIEVKA